MKVKQKVTDEVMEIVGYVACNQTPVAICRSGNTLRGVELSALEIVEEKPAETYREHQAKWDSKAEKEARTLHVDEGKEDRTVVTKVKKK